ncbi:MAG: EAL domain-containing protein [Hyphomicrobiales bacterium]|nr:EAL domain-containing protein [Hyphomicrobiales bacterium]
MRLGAVFIAICMVVIAASAGATVHLGFGFSGAEALVVALAVLTALALYNSVATRLGVRTVVGSQIGELARGNAELARQTTEFNRRLAALEARLTLAQNQTRTATEPLAIEIGELGTLVRQLAESVAAHEARLGEIAAIAPREAAPAGTPAASPPAAAAAPLSGLAATVALVEAAVAPIPAPLPTSILTPMPISATPAAAGATTSPAVAMAAPVQPPVTASAAAAEPATATRLAAIRGAVEANRIDLQLQPIVTLPQRKVRYYEALSRLRSEAGEVLMPADFIGAAEQAGLMPRIDNLVVFRCVQVVRRLLLKNREIGLFCNLSIATLTDAAAFAQLLDFLEANRAIAPSLVLEFTQKSLRAAGPIETESLSALAERGFRFSLDNLDDLRIEPRDLAARGFRFVKVPGSLLLDPKGIATDIHTADLSDLLGRFGIDLIAEKIENEAVVVDLLDCDVRFGQGFLFSPPRPVRAEALQGNADRGEVIAPAPAAAEGAASGRGAAEPGAASGNGQRLSGLAQLARGATGRI